MSVVEGVYLPTIGYAVVIGRPSGKLFTDGRKHRRLDDAQSLAAFLTRSALESRKAIVVPVYDWSKLAGCGSLLRGSGYP